MMHYERECEASTRCRNCGGPHRSDSRICQARPIRTGPATIELLNTIRKYGQREHAAVIRAKAAAKRAEVAADATSKDIPMAQETSFGARPRNENLKSTANRGEHLTCGPRKGFRKLAVYEGYLQVHLCSQRRWSIVIWSLWQIRKRARSTNCGSNETSSSRILWRRAFVFFSRGGRSRSRVTVKKI